jgi:hypothetical protein
VEGVEGVLTSMPRVGFLVEVDPGCILAPLGSGPWNYSLATVTVRFCLGHRDFDARPVADVS